jgi:hypothetical protein
MFLSQSTLGNEAGLIRSREALRGTLLPTEPLYALGREDADEGYEIECELYGEVALPRKEDYEESSCAD